MKKVLFLSVFFLLTASLNWETDKDSPVSTAGDVIVHHGYNGSDMPLGDGEEKSGEEDKDFTDDDDVTLDHRGLSRKKSSYAGLHLLFQAKLFKDLEIEIVIPPPKA